MPPLRIPTRDDAAAHVADAARCGVYGGCIDQHQGSDMADLYLKALESERRSLWAACRLKGLAKDTPERLRIVELDGLIASHKQKTGR